MAKSIKRPWFKEDPGDPGILARVPGVLIADTSRGLPLPELHNIGDEVVAEATLYDGTRVWLFYLLVEHKHRRFTHRWWSCVRAQII